MRITTWNVNGLRAALRKDFGTHLSVLDPDVLLLQEVRARPRQLPDGWGRPDGYTALWHPAERNGYSGVAVWTRHDAEILETGLGGPDPEGRVLRVRTNGVQVVSVYLPSGSSGEARQAVKDDFLERFAAWLAPLATLDEPVIVAGDLNIAPTPADIHDPRGNARNSGFLPHERAWFAELLDNGWTDLVRRELGAQQGPYSWWSNRGRARELDRGWRIDHVLGNAAAAARTRAAQITRQGGLDTSDHAPVSVDLGKRPRKARAPAPS
jgi:exodeoxyribonuclease-3